MRMIYLNKSIKDTEPDVYKRQKLYYGELQISEMSPNVFIVLNSDFGEQVSLTFYDEPMKMCIRDRDIVGFASTNVDEPKYTR